MGNGSFGYFAISKESVAGTAITPPTKFLPVESVTFEGENEYIDIKQMALSRQAMTSLPGMFQPTANIKSPLYTSGAVGLILRGLTGGTPTNALETGATTGRHWTFVDGGSLPTFTLERSDAANGAGGILCQRLAGAKVESVSLSASMGEKVDFEANFQATEVMETATAVAAGSVVFPEETPLSFDGISVKVDGSDVSSFKSLQAEFRNTLDRQNVFNKTRKTYKIFEGGIEVSVSGTMLFEDLTWYNRFIDGTEFELVWDLVSPTVADEADTDPDVYYRMQITFPICCVSKYSIPYEADSIIEADVDLKVKYDFTDKLAFKIETWNNDGATAYNT